MSITENPESSKVIQLKISRALLALDGKDHFIIRNEDFSIYADTTDPKIVQRAKWVFEEDFEQYWDAELTVTRTGKKNIKLLKRIKDLHWDDYKEEDYYDEEKSI